MRWVLFFVSTLILLGVPVTSHSAEPKKAEQSPALEVTATRPNAADALATLAPAVRARVIDGYGKLPLTFEANRGQMDDQGDLVLHVAGGEVRLNRPVVYQGNEAERVAIDVVVTKFNASGSGLIFSTYLNGTAASPSEPLGPRSFADNIAVDAAGNAYVTGATGTTNFPTTDRVLQPSFAGLRSDAFVTKLSANGSLVYSTYLGGRYNDSGRGIVIDVSGSAYVFGQTDSDDFPTTLGAFQPHGHSAHHERGYLGSLEMVTALMSRQPMMGTPSWPVKTTLVTETLRSRHDFERFKLGEGAKFQETWI
jgi:hypothetical protein